MMGFINQKPSICNMCANMHQYDMYWQILRKHGHALASPTCTLLASSGQAVLSRSDCKDVDNKSKTSTSKIGSN